ncbi:hypothetical protein SDC9_101256 [bioreactor metagenome]|uniref:Uncharacterized protein n=1 Tax=bioreactor metagenome TaxID=1076179 RepID=A0A645ANY6_9ZZZZ
MSSASQRQARIQIRRATEALNALAERDDQGAVLAAQLAGLVAVLAETATDGTQFNAGLVTALAGPVGPKVAGETHVAKAAEAPDVAAAPDATTVSQASGQDEAVDDQRRRLNAMTVAQLRALIKEQRIPHPQISALSKAKKADLIETIAADTPLAGQQAGGKRKRMPSVLDPYALARQEGEAALRARLGDLDVDQLKDLVHDYGMDYDHRAMRWTDQQRLIGRIIERVDFGTTQGSAFRDAALPENP